MTQHCTPGPWTRIDYDDSVELWNLQAKPQFPVCTIDRDGPYESNIRLIRAAQLLLEACKAIADAYASDGSTKRQKEAHALIRAAVSAAEEPDR